MKVFYFNAQTLRKIIFQELFILFLALVYPKLWLLQHEVMQVYTVGEKNKSVAGTT